MGVVNSGDSMHFRASPFLIHGDVQGCTSQFKSFLNVNEC